MSTFTWQIDDSQLIEKIKHAKNGAEFTSDPFRMHGFTWILELSPNGYDIANEGVVELYLKLAFLPPNIKSISIRRESKFIEGNVSSAESYRFNEATAYSWSYDTLKLKDIQHHKQFTFTAYIYISEVLNQQDKDITFNHLLVSKFKDTDTAKKPDDYKTALLLINGYSRNMQNNLTQIIPEHVIKLYFDYFLVNQNHFEWKITDKNHIKSIKTAPFGKYFQGHTFSAYGIKWFLALWPNGHCQEGSVGLHLQLAFLPSHIKTVYVGIEFKFTESNVIRVYENDYTVGQTLYGWGCKDTLKLSEIKKYNQLTFSTKIKLHGVVSNNDEDITDKYLNLSCLNTIIPLSLYEWNIDNPQLVQSMQNAANRERFDSKIFIAHGFKWFLRIYPNGNKNRQGKVQIYLYLAYLPHNIESVATKVRFIEKHTQYSDDTYAVFKSGDMSWGWLSKPLSFDEIQNFEQLNYIVQIELCGVSDGSSDVTSKYINYQNLFSQSKEMNNPIATVTWVITEEKDAEILDAMKIANNMQHWSSSLFSAFGFKWFITIHPNGFNKETENYVNIFLNSLALSLTNIKLAVRFELELVELNMCFKYRTVFSEANDNWGCVDKKMKADDFRKLTQVTIKASVEVYEVIDEHNNDITSKYIHPQNSLYYPMKQIKNVNTSFTWKITKEILHAMKNAKNRQNWESPIFDRFGLKWFISMFPNGDEADTNHVSLFLHAAFLPTKIKAMQIGYECKVGETNTVLRSQDVFKHGTLGWGWTNTPLKFEDIEDLNTVTITFKMSLYGIIDNQNNDIISEYTNKQNSVGYPEKPIRDTLFKLFTWSITEGKDKDLLNSIKDAKNTETWRSAVFDAFGFKWFLEIAPNGHIEETKGHVNVFLYMAFLPRKVKAVAVGFDLDMVEINNFEFFTTQHVFKDGILNFGWADKRLKCEAIKNLSKLTITVRIRLYGVIDENDNDITSKFLYWRNDGNEVTNIINHDIQHSKIVTIIDGILDVFDR